MTVYTSYACICVVSSVNVFVGSACSGLVSATLGTPADVVKTRVMNQPTDQHGRCGHVSQGSDNVSGPGDINAAQIGTNESHTFRPSRPRKVAGVGR